MEYETLKTDAIIIKEKEFGEADKVFAVYTKDFGKIEILGKGIRKAKAKLRSGLQVLNYISLEFVMGKNFYIATDAILETAFSNLKSDPKRFRSGLYIAQLLDELVKGEEKDKQIWDLFLEILKNLQAYPLTNLSAYRFILRYFEWNLISLLGLKPELYHCVGCQHKIQAGKFFFSAKEGGIICEKCQMSPNDPALFLKRAGPTGQANVKCQNISRDAIKILRLIISRDEAILRRLKINSVQEGELKEISKLFLFWVLEKEIFVV